MSLPIQDDSRWPNQDALSIAVQAVIDVAPPAWNVTDAESALTMLRQALDEIAYIDFSFANANRRPFEDNDFGFLDDDIDADGSTY